MLCYIFLYFETLAGWIAEQMIRCHLQWTVLISKYTRGDSLEEKQKLYNDNTREVLCSL